MAFIPCSDLVAAASTGEGNDESVEHEGAIGSGPSAKIDASRLTRLADRNDDLAVDDLNTAPCERTQAAIRPLATTLSHTARVIR